MTDVVIELKNIGLEDKGKRILEDVSFSIEKGELIFIVGPSGGGKSSLLKIIGSLKEQSRGEILFEGENYKNINPLSLRKKVRYCFQNPTLFGRKVIEDLEYPFNISKEKVDMERIKYLLKKFNLEESILEKQSDVLSGGEKQRIALIRSLIFMPEVLLLDEVTSALDEENKMITEKALIDLKDDGVTLVFVTHDQEQVIRHKGRVIEMKNGKVKGGERFE